MESSECDSAISSIFLIHFMCLTEFMLGISCSPEPASPSYQQTLEAPSKLKTERIIGKDRV